ncbi:NAD(P)H-hydrate dehydratase [Rhodoblastus acidophilus]|uniref:Bifunctional NAD(P)H-hydrate repair enzyme n=1 Tax=Rhodoblastus acidophilus TaxID=1074 RepID=A0A6N8DRD0_RHOAC|nr:NAD(P)H-hydrate dehydratase [Rhodoblastus acidophilus]
MELLTPEEMGRADALAIAGGVPGYALMLKAGKNVAEAAAALLRDKGSRRVAVFCGPGNNGGDGYVAARLLRETGFDVEVGALGEPRFLRGDAKQAFEDWAGETCAAEEVDPARADVVIDALFGAGLSRPLDGRALELVERLNAAGKPILAVDVPSGLDGATGLGPGCVQAQKTVTFFRKKPGHVLLPGRLACGDLLVTQIGIDAGFLADIAPKTFENLPPLWLGLMPKPQVAGHKYSRGHLLVASGPMTRTGAARLAARAGLRAGAGLVTVVSPADALAVNAAHLTAIMLRAADGADQWRDLLADRRFSGCVFGPAFGVAPETAEIAAVLLAAATPDRPLGLVLDADALTAFSGDWRALARCITSSAARVVITPHDGEFYRLFNEQAEKPQPAQPDGHDLTSSRRTEAQPVDCRSKLDKARVAAERLGAVIVLKGPDTVVASPDGRAAIAANAPPTLATAGSGDVLAGIIGGLLAQGMPAFEAAACAVWLHGEAANAFGRGLIAEDLSEMLPRVLAHL